MNLYPMIGIAGSINKDEDSHSINRTYMRALRNSGAIPVMLSYDMEGEALERWLLAFCKRKWNCDFSREMSRSAAQILKDWSEGK